MLIQFLGLLIFQFYQILLKILFKGRGPAPCLPPSDQQDIIDEALYYFKVIGFIIIYLLCEDLKLRMESW